VALLVDVVRPFVFELLGVLILVLDALETVDPAELLLVVDRDGAFDLLERLHPEPLESHKLGVGRAVADKVDVDCSHAVLGALGLVLVRVD